MIFVFQLFAPLSTREAKLVVEPGEGVEHDSRRTRTVGDLAEEPLTIVVRPMNLLPPASAVGDVVTTISRTDQGIVKAVMIRRCRQGEAERERGVIVAEVSWPLRRSSRRRRSLAATLAQQLDLDVEA